MADQQELIIQLQVQIGDTLAQLQAVQSQVADMGAAAQGAVAPVTGLGAAFSTAIGGIAMVAVSMLSRKMIQYGKDAVDAFTKADAAAKEFANTLEQRDLSVASANAAVGAVANMAVPAGFDPQEIEQAMSNVIVKMHSGANAVLAFQAAMDNARIKGISLATSIQSVTIAAEGSLKALRQFGITTNKDVNGNLKTESELLKEIATNTRGGLATYMETPLGMIDRMKVSLQELKNAIGSNITQAFAPVAASVMGFGQALSASIAVIHGSMPAFNELAIVGARLGQVIFNTGMIIRSVFDVVGTGIAGIAAILTGKGRAAIDQFKDNIKTLWDQAVAGNDAINNLVKSLSTSTPEDNVKQQMEELQQLLKGITTGENAATASAEKWSAAFAPLTLLSGNLPQLAKYVGNLSSNFVLRSRLDININDNTKPASNSAQNSVKSAVTSAIKGAWIGATGFSKSTVASSHGASLWSNLVGDNIGVGPWNKAYGN